MTTFNSPVLGLSIGSTTLAAVAADRSVTGRPVLSRGGWVIDDFVHRVGDPIGIVAPDGSVHTAAGLLAEALHELARSATAGRPLPGAVTVAYPACWRPAAVEALGRALRRIPAWSTGVVLLPDHAAALGALGRHPGLPGRGVIAVCDFGAAASVLTLVDAGNGLRTIGESLRYNDFGGDMIDRALLAHVLTAAGTSAGATGTSSLKALTRLRNECRDAKERLSTATVTTVPGAPAGLRGDIRITRPELDGMVVEPMSGVVSAIRDTLRRNGIELTDLVAVVSVGGMAAVASVTTTLSEQLRVPVITTRRPELAAAIGAALSAERGTAADAKTVITPAAAHPELAGTALAWSQAPDIPEVLPQRSARRRDPRPVLDFTPEPVAAGFDRMPWHRRPLVVAAAVLAVVAGAGGATALALRVDTAASPAPPAVGAARAPAPVTPAADAAREPRTVVAVPGPTGPSPETVLAAPASEAPAPEAPAAPATEAPPPPTESAPVAEAATEAAAGAPPPPLIPAIPPLPTIPPIPIPAIPGLPTQLPLPPPSG